MWVILTQFDFFSIRFSDNIEIQIFFPIFFQKNCQQLFLIIFFVEKYSKRFDFIVKKLSMIFYIIFIYIIFFANFT